MAYLIGIAGPPNSGKSFSRKSIPDGENVIVLQPSIKAAHLKTSEGKPVRPFDIDTPSFKSLQEAMAAMGANHPALVIDRWNREAPEGTFKRENFKGNIIRIKTLQEIMHWAYFVSKHMPWVHTLILPDFTHFISETVSDSGFINRKVGGEAYQRFWELAADALHNFITHPQELREDLLIVTEYHARPDEAGVYDIFVPAGNMLTEKFLPTSYYDVLVFTHIKMPAEATAKPEFMFVTRPTMKYPFARTMDLFETTYVPNDLQLLMTKVREYIGIPMPNA